MKKQFLVTIENGEDISDNYIADSLWHALDEFDYGSFSVIEITREEEKEND